MSYELTLAAIIDGGNRVIIFADLSKARMYPNADTGISGRHERIFSWNKSKTIQVWAMIHRRDTFLYIEVDCFTLNYEAFEDPLQYAQAKAIVYSKG